MTQRKISYRIIWLLAGIDRALIHTINLLYFKESYMNLQIKCRDRRQFYLLIYVINENSYYGYNFVCVCVRLNGYKMRL